MPILSNPWFILGMLLAWAGSVTTTAIWQRDEGRQLERAVWVEKQAKQAEVRNAEQLAMAHFATTLEQQARLIEQDEAKRLNLVSANYERKLSNATKANTAALDAIRNGHIVLRVPAEAAPSRSGPLSGDSLATCQRDGAQTGQLPRGTAEFLFGQASLADQITEQLTACQEVIQELQWQDRAQPDGGASGSPGHPPQ
ncbi:hypothetical protein ED236_00425 [Pseudomethylobacillus aquaticus]|uniref:Lysis protein n=1 Tax=Pseudomethylobacillus aquaticus TaxID=2676064 RepID=A0A3N0V5K6_9PROT|nr:lysis system i-spanin subunit Rz [Pseudomethylobacillus aquaticus]ROH87993.1 hypothetical protein ED236_00425 [Pseudomethylobacillus aquaticus]